VLDDHLAEIAVADAAASEPALACTERGLRLDCCFVQDESTPLVGRAVASCSLVHRRRLACRPET
jgi:hypothetical protein